MNKQIDYSDLFMLDEPSATRPFRLKSQQNWVMQKDCELFEGEYQPPEPVLLKAFMGGSPADFLWSSLISIICISSRVFQLLEEYRFTGWATYPVKVYGRHGEFLPGYHGFAVKSSVGEEDLSRSSLINKPPRVPGGKPYKVYKGLYFDESKWEGSDIFRVLTTRYIIVTRKVRDAFKRSKVSNVRFRPLPEIERNASIFFQKPVDMK